MAKLWLLFLWLSELLCPSAAGRTISPRRSTTADACLIFKPHNKILLPLPGEIPPLRRSLGARSLSLGGDAPDGRGRQDSGAPGWRRQGPSCPLLSRTGWPWWCQRAGQGLRAQADASNWGPAARPHLPLSGCSRWGGGGASRRSRSARRAEPAMPGLRDTERH